MSSLIIWPFSVLHYGIGFDLLPTDVVALAHVAYITNGFSGNFNSSFELSRRLRLAGHQITYLSHANLEESISAEGHAFCRLTKDQVFRHHVDDIRASTGGKSPVQLWRRFDKLRQLRRESIANDEIESVIRRLAPDLLLIDMEMYFAVIAMNRLGIPRLLPMVWFSLYKCPGLPPLDSHLQPDNSWRNSCVTRFRYYQSMKRMTIVFSTSSYIRIGPNRTDTLSCPTIPDWG